MLPESQKIKFTLEKKRSIWEHGGAHKNLSALKIQKQDVVCWSEKKQIKIFVIVNFN